MSYLLHIDSSPQVETSTSRKVAAAFVEAYKQAHEGVTVVHRDLAVNPLLHIDSETLNAAYVPEEGRSESQAAKHKLRLDLIKEITEAKAIVISSPMYNWSIPSSLKAYIDQIIMPGELDPYLKQGLTGKPITFIIATGGAYGPESGKSESDFASGYLQFIAKNLGATDIEIIRAELQLAGVAPGMEELVPLKEASTAKALETAAARAAAI